jgi:2-polyprenyl-3-methyl-5-hydroxy-6-metoxy-1,4-benzoquinol methylase
MKLNDQWNDFLLRGVDPYATAKYEILMSWLGELRGKTVLVVGSGSGEFCVLLAKAGAIVTAIDISEEYVQLTQKTAQRFGVQFKTAVSKLEDFKTSEKYDFVAATDVVEHIENDREAIRQLRALLNSNGKLILTVPALGFLFGYHDEILGHFRRYDAQSLRKLVSQDFKITALRYYGFLLIPVALTISRILRRPYPTSSFEAAGDKKSVTGAVIRSVFRVEKHVKPPLGTSLLLLASPA